MSCKTALFAAIVASCLSTIAHAEYRNIGLISESQAQRFGLQRTWFTHVNVDPAIGQIKHILHYVSSIDTYTVHEVKYEGRKRLFSENSLDRFGDLLGKKGAERAAKNFAKDLKIKGIESTTETHDVPVITLYVTTNRGVLHAIDGETGRTLWTTLIGKPHYPTERPAASEQYLAIVNGADIYLLKRQTGEIAWVRKTLGVPGAGPGLNDDFIAVPMIKGNVELYDLNETRTLPAIYKSNGRALVQPTVTPLSIAWPTDRGFLYVASATKRGVRYRLEAKNTITSPATFFEPSQFFVASIDGYVYNVNEISGAEKWRFSTGEAISNSPIPAGDKVFVVTDEQRLFCVDMETGAELWWAPRVKRLIAVSKDRVYCVGELDRLAIIDLKTGGSIATMNIDLLDLQYENTQTDRIFIGTKTGIIQCLREPAMEFPLIHAAAAEAETNRRPEIIQDEPEPAPVKPQPKEPQPPAGGNPFDGANPFGGGNQGGGNAGGGNPFGGGNQGGGNPFGGGGNQGGGNPFGGGGNPFGGGGNQGGGNQGGGNPFGGGGNQGGGNPFGGGNPGAGNPGGGNPNPFGGGNPNPFDGANPF